MQNRNTGRYNVTQKYYDKRAGYQLPLSSSTLTSKKRFSVVVDIPMSQNVLTAMVCFIKGC